MKLKELFESRMGEADDIYRRAEAKAYDEAAEQKHGVSGDRILAIAKQIIHNEVKDPVVAKGMEKVIAQAIEDDIHPGRWPMKK